MLSPGQKVTLACDNPYLDGRKVEVETVTTYGAVVLTGVGSGAFRAMFSEIVECRTQLNGTPAAKDMGYTGDLCDTCGSAKMRRNGACLLCEGCGASSGCG